jgi:16S rRNA (uracil1498-N3)-methyltransferase
MEIIQPAQGVVSLHEEASRHIIQVLRMKKGEKLQLTDGLGSLHTAQIIDDFKKMARVEILQSERLEPSPGKIIIGISLVKNTSRFEWFLEKATEIGVTEIIPIICERTERQHFRSDRMKSITISAMLQSQQAWLPKLWEPIPFDQGIARVIAAQKLIAHCLPGNKQTIKNLLQNKPDIAIFIGPEGDFTGTEIELALQSNFVPVSLGETRLRTETAGIVAATLLRNVHL